MTEKLSDMKLAIMNLLDKYENEAIRTGYAKGFDEGRKFDVVDDTNSRCEVTP